MLLYFLSAVMHFLPDNNYKKYIQFYMGLLLILLLLSPVLDFLQLENKIDAGVDRYMEEEERDREEWENYAREIEEEYGWNKKVRIPGIHSRRMRKIPCRKERWDHEAISGNAEKGADCGSAAGRHPAAHHCHACEEKGYRGTDCQEYTHKRSKPENQL
ncbi:stage III sporulation protein AF [Blautia sp. RD014234]|nr:stage III sporulation protein AF [Blautia parvula]